MFLIAIIVCASSFVDTSHPNIFSKMNCQSSDLACSVPSVALTRRLSVVYRLRGGSDHMHLGPPEFQSLQSNRDTIIVHSNMNISENGNDILPERGRSQGESDQQSNSAEARNDNRPMDESETCSNSEDSDACVDEGGLPLNMNFSAKENATSSRIQRGCRHYSRGCQLRAPCCDILFWCRHCHNEAMDTGDPKKAHQLDRFAVKWVRCGKCDLEQQVQRNCNGCGHLFGEYFCPICKFFDDDLSKGVFHCDGCGICRVGGRENFFHCSACGCCYAVQLRSNHKCISGAMHHNCPVCLENLFHSTSQVRVLRCGHTLHKKCLEQLLRRPATVRTCPLCSKTIVDHQLTWQQVQTLPCPPLVCLACGPALPRRIDQEPALHRTERRIEPTSTSPPPPPSPPRRIHP
jgi:RING finger/CHY zinc finger protein 1